MALKLRLARQGRKAVPFYSIVVADSRSPRDGRYIEKIGTYDPRQPKDSDRRVIINGERVTYWLSKVTQGGIIAFLSLMAVWWPLQSVSLRMLSEMELIIFLRL